MGIDLKAGDEVVTTEQDYGAHAHHVGPAGAARQDQGDAHRLPGAPTTQDDLLKRFEGAITPRTKVLHFCHITNQSGQLFPVQRAEPAGARARHHHHRRRRPRHGHFPFTLRDLEMDYYGVSLHKWLLAPLGTGLLYVRRDRIASTWPLQAAPATRRHRHPEVRGDRHAPAGRRAPRSTRRVAFQQAIGIERKAARLRYLTLRWANELKKEPRVRLHSSLEPGQTWGLAVVSIDGIDSSKLVTPPLGQVPHRHRGGRRTRTRRSRASPTAACASRRISTRRSRRSIRSSRRCGA